MNGGGKPRSYRWFDNSVKFATDVTVSLKNGKAGCEIRVTDNGPGIREPLQRRLFEPVNSTKGDGHSGLGLSIVSRLCRRFGWGFSIESEPGEGTRVTIEWVPKEVD